MVLVTKLKIPRKCTAYDRTLTGDFKFLFIFHSSNLNIFIKVLCVQVKCFEEIINIGYAVYRVHGLPWFRSLSWYFLLTSNYFFYGENLIDSFGVVINRTVSILTIHPHTYHTNNSCSPIRQS